MKHILNENYHLISYGSFNMCLDELKSLKEWAENGFQKIKSHLDSLMGVEGRKEEEIFWRMMQKKASACVTIVNSKFDKLKELHQNYKTGFER